jgi:hypothetical protein
VEVVLILIEVVEVELEVIELLVLGLLHYKPLP